MSNNHPTPTAPAPSPETPLVEGRRLNKRYCFGDGEVPALCDLSLSVEEKAFTAISGPSGSGKSTLLNILGLLDIPDSGELLFCGKSIDYWSAREMESLRRSALGFVFQNFNLVPVLSALENVELPLLTRAMTPKERRERAAEMLDAVGLGSRLKHLPRELSGGQQQRVAVARALVGQPKLVLADEPTANLDSKTAMQIIDLMRQLNEARGIAFIISTHDQRVLDGVRTVLRLSDGRLC